MHERGLKREQLASIRKSGPEIKNRCIKDGGNRENPVSIRKFGPEIKNRCRLWDSSWEILASIPKSGPEIKNRCRLWVVSGEIHASIRKSGPEIKNRCTKEGVNRQNLASIPKSGPEIKNRCRSGVATTVCRRNHSSLQRRRLVSVTNVVADISGKSAISLRKFRAHPRIRRLQRSGSLAESLHRKKRAPHLRERLSAVRTRLELATPGVTGRYSNRLNYRTSPASLLEGIAKIVTFFNSTRVASDFFISL